MKNEYGPVPGFLVLVFVLSIPFWLLGHLYPVQLLPGLPISSLAVLTPTLAAAIMAYRNGGLPAVRHLLGRSFDVQRIGHKAWYLLFVLFNPMVAVLVFGIMRATGRPVPPPAPLTSAVLPMLASFFIAALAEEIGWTGYATESLQRRWGILKAGLLLGLVWVVFHLVLLSQVDRSLEWIAWWSLGTLALRTFMVWLYRHAGKSVFAAALFHTMINLAWQLFPVNGSFYDPRLFSLVTLCLAAVIALARRLTSRERQPAA